MFCSRLPMVVAVCLPLVATGCETPKMRTEDPAAETYLRLLMPTKVEIKHFSRPVSLHGDGKADGMEVQVATLDSFGEAIKSAGTFHIELYQARNSAADQMGRRIAFWPVTIDSEKSLKEYWDGLARLYIFRLKLPDETLKADRYILNVQLNLPADVRLFSEQEFNFTGGVAPNVTPPNR